MRKPQKYYGNGKPLYYGDESVLLVLSFVMKYKSIDVWCVSDEEDGNDSCWWGAA